MPITARIVILGQFVVVVLGVLALVTFKMFISSSSELLIDLVGIPILGISALVVLFHAVWRPSWKKTALCVCFLVGGGSLLLLTPYASQAGIQLFFLSRQTVLEEFAQDILAYGRITNMSDGSRHFKQLNGELVAYTPSNVSLSHDEAVRSIVLLEDVLHRDGIDRQRYDDYRDRLGRLNLVEFEVTSSHVAFLYDGILDNLQGFLLLRSGMPESIMNSYVFSSRVVAISALGGQWYWFATT